MPLGGYRENWWGNSEQWYGSQQQKLKFQGHVFSKFHDNFGTFCGLKNITHTKSLRVTWHKSVMNIKKAVIHYSITNYVNEIVIMPCICISKILDSHTLWQNYGQYRVICIK